MNRKQKIATLALALVAASSIAAAAPEAVAPVRHLVNVNAQGVVVDGYDVVAYFTDGKPTQGSSAISSEYDGGIYWFASAEHKELFETASRRTSRRWMKRWAHLALPPCPVACPPTPVGTRSSRCLGSTATTLGSSSFSSVRPRSFTPATSSNLSATASSY